MGTLANNQDNSGYTGHEQLDQLGLVHMGARLYDPITGRHTSADPTVPDPANAQAFNRYSYVLNNALAFVDPTGLSPVSMEDRDGTKESRWWSAMLRGKEDPTYWEALTEPLEQHAAIFGSLYEASERIQKSIEAQRKQSDAEMSAAIQAAGREVALWNTFNGMAKNAQSSRNGSGILLASNGTEAAIQVGSGLKDLIDGGGGRRAQAAFDRGEPGLAAAEVAYGTVHATMFVVTGGQGAAVTKAVTSFFGRGAAKGTATILQDGRHVSVAVRHGDNVLHTEQVILGNGATTIAKQTGASGTTGSLTVSLPNAKAAIDYQRSVLGTNTGAYNLSTNSCLTHCGDVLRAGGVAGVPSTTSELMRWLRNLGE